MLNDHARDLINGAVDDELSEPEWAEHEALLAGSEDARTYSEALRALTSLLEQLPPIAPPANLQRRILQQIQLPRPRRWFTWSAAWMQGGPTSYAAAVAAGLMVAVAIYELTPTLDPGTDYPSLVGTLARGEGLEGAQQMGALEIDLPAVHGRISLSGSEDLKLLRFDVASDAEVEFEVGLAGSGLAFGGFAQEAEAGTDNIRYSGGRLTVSNLGEHRFTVILRDGPAEADAGEGIVVSVTRQGESLYRGVLSL